VAFTVSARTTSAPASKPAQNLGAALAQRFDQPHHRSARLIPQLPPAPLALTQSTAPAECRIGGSPPPRCPSWQAAGRPGP